MNIKNHGPKTDTYFTITWSNDDIFTITATDTKHDNKIVFEAEFESNLYNDPIAEVILEYLLYKINRNYLPVPEEKALMVHELRTHNKLEPVYVNKRDAFVLGIFRIAWVIDNIDKDYERSEQPTLLECFLEGMKNPPNRIHLGGKIKTFDSHLAISFSSIQSRAREAAPTKTAITVPESNDKQIETQLNIIRKVMRQSQRNETELRKVISKIEELTYDIHLIKEQLEKDDANIPDESN